MEIVIAVVGFSAGYLLSQYGHKDERKAYQEHNTRLLNALYARLGVKVKEPEEEVILNTQGIVDKPKKEGRIDLAPPSLEAMRAEAFANEVQQQK